MKMVSWLKFFVQAVLIIAISFVVAYVVAYKFLASHLNQFEKEIRAEQKQINVKSVMTEGFDITDDKHNVIMSFGYDDNEEYPAPTIFKIYEPGTTFDRVIGFLSKNGSKLYVKQIITDSCVTLTPDAEDLFKDKSCYSIEHRKSQRCCMKSVLIK